MESGSPSAPEARRRSEADAPRPAFIALAKTILLAAALASSCASCAAVKRSAFERSLERIDSALAAKEPGRAAKAYESAYRAASSAADWLSVLKRARASEAAGDRGRFVGAARRAVSAVPGSEPVAAAAAYAMLRAGDPASALALFKGRLSPDRRPTLWQECFLAAASSGALAAMDPAPEDFARLAEARGEARAYAGAAAAALARGEAALAASYAEKAESGGARLPAALRWDCGLYERLAGRPDAGASAEELAIMGDAAWAIGDAALARSRWQAAIAADPRASWKPYAKLALSSGEGDYADSAIARMKAAFLEGGGARADAAVAYASILAARGRTEEAEAALAPFGDDAAASALAMRLGGAGEPEGRLAAEAMRFAESGKQGAAGYGLAILAELGRADDLVALCGSLEASGRDYPDRWFYEAAARLASGDYGAAAEAVERGGDRGPEAALELGIAYRAMGDLEKARKSLRAAASGFAEPSARCLALKELGAAAESSGAAKEAAEAYRAAAAADPSDSEAALLARGR
jgi:hypothetical protein